MSLADANESPVSVSSLILLFLLFQKCPCLLSSFNPSFLTQMSMCTHTHTLFGKIWLWEFKAFLAVHTFLWLDWCDSFLLFPFLNFSSRASVLACAITGRNSYLPHQEASFCALTVWNCPCFSNSRVRFNLLVMLFQRFQLNFCWRMHSAASVWVFVSPEPALAKLPPPSAQPLPTPTC